MAVRLTATQTGGGRAKKLSKVQILRAATHYISQLRQLLMNRDADADWVASDARTLPTQDASSSSSSSGGGGGNFVSARVEDQPGPEQADDSSPAHNRRMTISLFLISRRLVYV